jgi:hypothetical protein
MVCLALGRALVRGGLLMAVACGLAGVYAWWDGPAWSEAQAAARWSGAPQVPALLRIGRPASETPAIRAITERAAAARTASPARPEWRTVAASHFHKSEPCGAAVWTCTEFRRPPPDLL